MSGSGRFEETIAFADAGAQTRIECSIGLRATLPVALSLRLVPRARLDAAADRIFRRRLDEIKRFDMPGFRPNEHYVRELKRFGVLRCGRRCLVRCAR